ncbi:hypothetical protein Tco_1095605, partial [Tanacetum coccineum]
SNLEEIFSSFLDMIHASHKPKGAIEVDVKQKQLNAIEEKSKDAFIILVQLSGFHSTTSF